MTDDNVIDLSALQSPPEEVPEEVQELFEQQVTLPVPGGQIQEVPYPAEIVHSIGDISFRFFADSGPSWGYNPVGIYAVGKYDAYADKDAENVETVFIPYPSVKVIKFDFARFKEQIEAENDEDDSD